MTCPEWIQRKWHGENDHKTCSFIQALFSYRLEYCHEMWFQNAEHMQTQLKKSFVYSVPTLGTYNAVDVFPSCIFLLSESVQSKLGHSNFVLQTEPKRSHLFYFLFRMKDITNVINELQRPDQETKLFFLTNIILRKIPRSFCLPFCFLRVVVSVCFFFFSFLRIDVSVFKG